MKRDPFNFLKLESGVFDILLVGTNWPHHLGSSHSTFTHTYIYIYTHTYTVKFHISYTLNERCLQFPFTSHLLVNSCIQVDNLAEHFTEHGAHVAPPQAVASETRVFFYAMQLTLLGTNRTPPKALLNMFFPFPRWDMLVSRRVPELGGTNFCQIVQLIIQIKERSWKGILFQPNASCWNQNWDTNSDTHVPMNKQGWYISFKRKDYSSFRDDGSSLRSSIRFSSIFMKDSPWDDSILHMNHQDP